MRSRLTEASEHRGEQDPGLDQDHLAVRRQPERVEDGQVQHGGADAGAEQDEHRDERDVREARHADGEAGDPLRGRKAAPDDEQSDRARRARPSRRRDGASRAATATPRGDGLRRRARPRPAGRALRRRRRARPPSARSAATERCSRSRPVDPDRDRGRDDEEREAELHVDVAAAERRQPPERHERRRRPRTSAASRSRPPPRGRPGSRSGRATATTPNATVSARRLVPATRRTSGRAIAIRSTNSPIATITRQEGEPLRDHERRRGRRLPRCAGSRTAAPGPAFGPTAKVNAPCTGWPSTEIARQ